MVKDAFEPKEWPKPAPDRRQFALCGGVAEAVPADGLSVGRGIFVLPPGTPGTRGATTPRSLGDHAARCTDPQTWRLQDGDLI